MWRALVLVHRYLGILVGLLMAAWFGSGIVMMYAGYPRPAEPERLQALAPIDWHTCCHLADGLFDDNQQFTDIQIESLLGTPVLRVRRPPLPDELIDLAQGSARDIDDNDARLIALFAASRLIGPDSAITDAATIEGDQWTFGIRGGDLYRFGFNDPGGSRFYVGSSGRIALHTTARQRFWAWLGAIPHWLYLEPLRTNGQLWSQIVIWTSLLGSFLTVLGLYLGIAQFRRGKSRALSPYRGLFYWHHLAGLVFGVMTLTFVVSGLISMNPWGFLESRRGGEAARIAGPAPRWSEIRASLANLQARAPNAVSLTGKPFAGHLYWLSTGADGTVARLDGTGNMAPLTDADLAQAATRLADTNEIATQELITQEDTYYFSHHDQVVLPAWRVILNDAGRTRYYLDPTSGALLQRTTINGRWHRWLFGGLHRLDFTAALRARPLWDIVMLVLLLGGIGLSATGVYLALRRIRSDVSGLLRSFGKGYRLVAPRAKSS